MASLSRVAVKVSAVALTLLTLSSALVSAQTSSACYNNLIEFNCPAGALIFRGCYSSVSATASAGKLLHWDFEDDSGETFSTLAGFDPCLYTTCQGIRCLNGYTMIQGVQGATIWSPPTQFLPLNDSSSEMTRRCVCGDAVLSIQDASAPYYVDPTGPSTTQNDEACAGMTCSDDPSVAVMYFAHSSTGLRENCTCCKKDTSKFYIDWSSSSAPVCGDTLPYTSSASSHGAVPTPVEPEDTIEGFVSHACPASSVTDTILNAITATPSDFCCYFTTTATSTTASNTSTVCGTDLLAIRKAGELTCVSTAANTTVNCCADISDAGVLTQRGTYCPYASWYSREAAAAGAASLTPLVSLVVAVISALALAL